MMATVSQGKRKEHAKHNERVYTFLKQEEEFIDWRITTAFYSALHYVDYKLFPLTETFAGKKRTFQDIQHYAEFFSKSKHKARIKAVKKHLKGCRAQYVDLFDLSMNARYHHYSFNNPGRIDTKIEKDLKAIKDTCT